MSKGEGRWLGLVRVIVKIMVSKGQVRVRVRVSQGRVRVRA